MGMRICEEAGIRRAWRHGKRVIDRAETIDGIAAGREFGKWVDNLLIVADVSARPSHHRILTPILRLSQSGRVESLS